MENYNLLIMPMNPRVKQVNMNFLEIYATHYCSLVESLIHLNIVRWNVTFAVFNCSRFMNKPHEAHL